MLDLYVMYLYWMLTIQYQLYCCVDNDSLGFWDYIGMGLYNQRWHCWLVMNARAVDYFMLFMSTIVWCYICGIGLSPYIVIQLVNLLCGIGLLPYVVIQLMNLSYGIGLLSYVIMQLMIIHQGWILDRVITL